MNPVSNSFLSNLDFVKTLPAFFKGKSEYRVRVFFESGFSTGLSQ